MKLQQCASDLLPRRHRRSHGRRCPGGTTRRRGGIPPLALSPIRREALYRAVIESAKAACDPETWERASAEGRAMSLDEAAEHAAFSCLSTGGADTSNGEFW